MTTLAGFLGYVKSTLVQVEGLSVVRRPTINFINGPTATDDAGNNRVNLDFTAVKRVAYPSVDSSDLPSSGVLDGQLATVIDVDRIRLAFFDGSDWRYADDPDETI